MFKQITVLALILALMLIVSPSLAGDEARQTIRGTITAPQLPDGRKVDFTRARVSIQENFQPVQPNYPEGYSEMSDAEKQAWMTEWTKSDDYRSWLMENQKRQAAAYRADASVNSDGTFRFDAVPTGQFIIRVKVNDPTLKKIILDGAMRLTVSEEEAEVELPLRVTPILEVGDMAPTFAVKTVDGKDLKLEDFRGKYVLVDFWAVWCGPCRAETPNLKGVFDSFGAHPKFAMIGLSLDKDPQAPIDYFKKHELGWINGFLGDWDEDKVTKKYGVRGIPQILLIGPDGRILAQGLRGDQTRVAVEKFLSQESVSAN